MKGKLRFFSVIAVVACLVVACAEKVEDDIEAKRKLAFETWMEMYGDGATRLSSGVYVKKLSSSSTSSVVKPPVDGNWVSLNYTGRTLYTGNIFVSRDSATARLMGSFEYYTHYVPEFVKFSKTDTVGVIEGVYDALATMNEGDVVRAYIPPSLAYGTYGASFSGGYEGQTTSVGGDVAIIMDLELEKIVADPVSYETELVQQFAYNKWGKRVDDTIAKNVYRQTLELGKKDTLTVSDDTTVCVYYVGRFLDGFIFDTNIADTAKKYNIYDTSIGTKYDSLKISTNGTDTSYIQGFYKAIVGMKFGETAETVFTSLYGYGSTAQTPDDGTWINPYTPLRYTIEVLHPNGEGTNLHPYNVAGFKAQKELEQGVWVRGYIVGAVEGTNVATDAVYSDTINVKTNILIADTRTANTAEKVIAVELPEGPMRDKLNLKDNPSIYRDQIEFKGDMAIYLGQVGMVNVEQYKMK